MRMSTRLVRPTSASTTTPGMTSITRSAARLSEARPVAGASFAFALAAAPAAWCRACFFAASDGGGTAGTVVTPAAAELELLPPRERAVLLPALRRAERCADAAERVALWVR